DVWGHDSGFDVEAFLRHIGSPRLQDVPQFAEWVEEAARQYDINQRILLAIAQKEQSFLTRVAGGKGWQRALDWTMGYGATDSGDIPSYRGTKTQIFSAARGLRRYWDYGMVQRMVGKPLGRSLSGVKDEATAAIVPENEATAALYLYTPYRSGAIVFARVWQWLKNQEREMGGLAASGGQLAGEKGEGASGAGFVRARVVDIAKRVARAREDGVKKLVINGISFEPQEAGYCAEFVREVYEAALGLAPHTWPYRGASARKMEKKLRAAAKQIPADRRQPGDIVAFNRMWPGRWGHVAIYLGKDAQGQDIVAEDTNSGVRVNRIGQRALHISGYYSVLPPLAAGYAPGPVKVVLLPEGKAVDCDAELVGDRVRCDLRPLAEALGATVYDHIADQRKVYLKMPVVIPRGGEASAGSGG
ncbi:MAG: C40 family peptidase, partial [Armatimonadetes bacterium]|nr:C40 family peptidase [Armatimonadota bacterium]